MHPSRNTIPRSVVFVPVACVVAACVDVDRCLEAMCSCSDAMGVFRVLRDTAVMTSVFLLLNW
jgi:hypothetical protein